MRANWPDSSFSFYSKTPRGSLLRQEVAFDRGAAVESQTKVVFLFFGNPILAESVVTGKQQSESGSDNSAGAVGITTTFKLRPLI